MKVWGVIATILLLVTIGVGGWLYLQNRNLESEKSQLEIDLASANTAKDQANAKMTAASKKITVLGMFFSGVNDADTQNEAYNLIKEMNDATLTADYKAMQNSQPGDTTGNKMLQDLLNAAVSDLK
jgi:hypothetical protein